MGYLPRSAFFIAIKMGLVILMMHSQKLELKQKRASKANKKDF